MKVMTIGLGQAGGKITDLFIKDDRASELPHTFEGIVVNTAISDLSGLKHVPSKDRILLGETLVKGHGVGADNKKGAEIARDEAEIVLNRVGKMGVSDMDAFFIIAGLGGGTGSGAISVLAMRLREVYDEPVYAIGVLPAENEGDIYTLNAARSLKALLPSADASILVDNGAFLRAGESVRQAYDRINSEIVRRIGIIARSGQIKSKKYVAEMVVDSSEVINTLKNGGICTIGYASERIKSKGGLGGIFKRKEYDVGKASRIVSVVKRSVKGRLLLPCEYQSANKGLIIIAGPPDQLDRKGIEKARQWLESSISGAEVRGGDYPLPKEKNVGSVVLLSGISNAPRVKYMLERAKVVQEKIAKGPLEEEDLDSLLGGIEKI